MTYLTAICPKIDVGTAAGLARREFDAFRGTLNKTRERFDEVGR